MCGRNPQRQRGQQLDVAAAHQPAREQRGGGGVAPGGSGCAGTAPQVVVDPDQKLVKEDVGEAEFESAKAGDRVVLTGGIYGIVSQVKEKNPSDLAAGIYLKRAANYMVNGTPADWTGVEALTEK